MMQASAWGRLGNDPRPIDTRSGKPMAVVSMAIDLADEGPPLWVGVVCFGRLSDQLLKHKKGDTLSASGRVQVNRWTDNSGEARERLEIVCDAVVSARTVRPGGKRKGNAGGADRALGGAGDYARETAADLPFDDEIPF